MSNRQKGEVTVEIGGTSYTLCMDMPAMVALEDHFSERAGREVYFPEIFEKVQKGSMRHLHVWIWAALLKHHPDQTLASVNGLIQAHGGVFEFSKVLERINAATTPDPNDLEALGIDTTANPQKAQAEKKAGTGPRSTSKRVASA